MFCIISHENDEQNNRKRGNISRHRIENLKKKKSKKKKIKFGRNWKKMMKRREEKWWNNGQTEKWITMKDAPEENKPITTHTQSLFKCVSC